MASEIFTILTNLGKEQLKGKVQEKGGQYFNKKGEDFGDFLSKIIDKGVDRISKKK